MLRLKILICRAKFGMGEVNSAASVESREILGAALASNINEKRRPFILRVSLTHPEKTRQILTRENFREEIIFELPECAYTRISALEKFFEIWKNNGCVSRENFEMTDTEWKDQVEDAEAAAQTLCETFYDIYDKKRQQIHKFYSEG